MDNTNVYNDKEADLIVSILNYELENAGYDVSTTGFGYDNHNVISAVDGSIEDSLTLIWDYIKAKHMESTNNNNNNNNNIKKDKNKILDSLKKEKEILITEQKELSLRVNSMYDTIKQYVMDSNNKDDYTLLVEQYVYMKGYLRILDKRIADVVSNIKCLKFNNNKK